ncbi:predicted protein [Sparassis crispa]|uniref:Homeobox domain-containing protein n=1 Tax=Sparassis crispa TaxID=139825 RepID=A0A401G6G5_9APHY|nr:predicted protein [Sparassis crispa]GBE77761.1 predicted protein [Sparassis crispa]
MSPAQRTPSPSSTMLSVASSAAPNPAKTPAEIPFVRKRLLHEQTTVLLTVFGEKTHPSREERAILAAELGMQLKTVSAWFQNRRRSIKKKSLTWSRRSMQENRRPAAAASRIKTSTQGPAISLDCIASARERPAHPPSNFGAMRPPLTPHRLNTANIFSLPSRQSTALWEHIPSSPPALPSSPMAESARFSVLGIHSKTARSLEWACAKARAAGTQGDGDVPMLDLDRASDTVTGGGDDDSDTETEDFEVITPDASAIQLFPMVSSPGAARRKVQATPPAEEMEAAMALLDFMGNGA